MAHPLVRGRRADHRRRTGTRLARSQHPMTYCSAGSPRIAAAVGRAQLAELRGDRDTAQARFRDALALHQEVDLPVEYAETLLEYGAFLRRYGQPTRAQPVLAQTIDVAEAAHAD